ncbi:uncharacterized protein LOC130591656 [Beta vulgaris subsp. vulgaris]|uniref:uncharacterized protein LOC130591656 n=1 Tax=Beta vulgaris subsp. vulgaris TaxID=3555 RepID=UPI002548F5AB|nr:uncharacterized protein LOC130591656 [Beta vulgaris subsp. vulgaris]
MNLGPWLDPTPLLPPERTIVMLQNRPIRLLEMSNTNAVLLARVQLPLKQMGVTVTWVEEKGLNYPRESELTLWPHRGRITNIETGEEYNLWAPENGELLRKFTGKPNLPFKMTVLYWNVRGIARPSFKPNLRLLIAQHHPKMVVLVETRVCRAKTTLILENIGFDSWHMVEPRGFAGGIIILWNSDCIKFHVVGDNIQGVHGVVEGVTPDVPGDQDYALQ